MSKLILVTGGAGFVGSHLCERLVRDGHRVISLDNYFTGSPGNHVAGVEYREGHSKDIHTRVPETPDIVFHLGEYARTEKSFEDVQIVFDLNKLGTFAVLEFCRRKKSKLIYAGSSTKFADGGSGRDQSPYAWSKATNTELVKNYGEWFGLSYAITYFYNVYGPREMSGAYGTLISIFSELTRLGQPLTVVLPGTQLRNFTHVNDIVNGLILVADKGVGDGYGIGADESFSVMEVATMFGGEILVMPERPGNRQSAGVDNGQVKALGWKQQHLLKDWIAGVKNTIGAVAAVPQRVLVYSTTFYPYMGTSEEALCDLIEAFPSVHFDIVTTAYVGGLSGDRCPHPNATVYGVGFGTPVDKYLLPILGAWRARQLLATNTYTFNWSLLASYGAVAAILGRRLSTQRKPILLTLADQPIGGIRAHSRFIMRALFKRADQIHVADSHQIGTVQAATRRATLLRSIGEGDAFANQLRIAYTNFLRSRLAKK